MTRRLPSPMATFSAAVALFLVVLTFLALQVRSGNDPALASRGQAQPRAVVTRHVTSASGRKVRTATPAPAPAPIQTRTS